MSQSTGRKPIQVSDDKLAGPYIMLPVDQLDWVRKRLEDNGVGFWVAHQSISFDGRPFETTIYLNRRSDPVQVQAILDADDRAGG